MPLIWKKKLEAESTEIIKPACGKGSFDDTHTPGVTLCHRARLPTPSVFPTVVPECLVVLSNRT